MRLQKGVLHSAIFLAGNDVLREDDEITRLALDGVEGDESLRFFNQCIQMEIRTDTVMVEKNKVLLAAVFF